MHHVHVYPCAIAVVTNMQWVCAARNPSPAVYSSGTWQYSETMLLLLWWRRFRLADSCAQLTIPCQHCTVLRHSAGRRLPLHLSGVRASESPGVVQAAAASEYTGCIASCWLCLCRTSQQAADRPAHSTTLLATAISWYCLPGSQPAGSLPGDTWDWLTWQSRLSWHACCACRAGRWLHSCTSLALWMSQ